VHGLIFFYLQKFADVAASGSGSWTGIRSSTATSVAKFLPTGVYPDTDAVAILTAIAETTGRPLPTILGEFGEFLAPHLVKVARSVIDPTWRTLDLIEHTEDIIHAMIRSTTPGAAPPVLEAVRPSPAELHLVYSSARHLCPLAVGLMRGIAAHYGETIHIEEPSCLLRGDPFCSFVVEQVANDTHQPRSPLTETLVFTPSTAGAPPDEAAATVLFAEDSLRNRLPTTIGGYKVLESIGQGAMGQVYLAEDAALGRRVAIKVMHPSRANDPAARRRFLRESRAAAAVEHPHVVAIYQVGEHRPPGSQGDGQPGLPYIVMQRLRGDTLGTYRTQVGRVPLAEALRIGREIAAGLAAAHASGLIHRDIKPDNIVLEGPSRQVKIIDFGLARDAGDDPSQAGITLDGSVVGTPAYMAPERFGDRVIDARADLFGLGVILYELLADRLPFTGTSMMAMLASISRGSPPPLASVAPGVPDDVSDLVMRLIAHEPADRPASAEAVTAEIAAIEKRLGNA
jgi:tRNA A-37 threonylcarbamoyl transferase component Bud32/predicted hydrocarbon binding protein